jgi:hypothetical protein
MNEIKSLDDAFAAIVNRQNEVRVHKQKILNAEWDKLMPLVGRIHALIPELKSNKPYLGNDRWLYRTSISGNYGNVIIEATSADPSNVTVCRSNGNQSELHIVINPYIDPERFILAVAERIKLCFASEIVTL